ncbi:MAG: SBBP repeat-containing protein [Elusimicrobiales bacterium]|nr:SBBP repeat-containing protein [Elusimicrobiales bacterium]
MTKKILSILFIIGLVLIFFSCPEIQPPTVTSVTPSDGATGIEINTNITAVFSEDMNEESINTTTFQLFDGTNPVTGTVNYDSAIKTATFDPSFDLGYSKSYTAKIMAEVTDLAGNQMVSEYSWTFTTIEEKTVATPTFSPEGGTYATAQSVTISCATSGATIRYTTDGSNPSEVAGTIYTSEIIINKTTTLKAIAYKTDWATSSVATATYTFQVATPTFSPGGGTYKTQQSVTISCATSGATIRYTTDGSNPSKTAGTIYTSEIIISKTTTLKAIAYKTDWATSSVATATYTITYTIWTRQIGTSVNDYAYAVAVDTSGNVYVTGCTPGGLDGNTLAGAADIVLIKYDTSGAKIWTRQIGTSVNDRAYAVAVDTSGNVYVTGYTGSGLDGNTSAGYNDIFLIKYDSNGNKIWTSQIGTSSDDYAYGVAVDTSGNVYVTGGTGGGLDGNTSAWFYDIFLIKYDSNGVRIWTRQIGTSEYDYAYGVAFDTSGNVYITGYTKCGLDGNTFAGGADIVLIKYDSNGNKIWTSQIGTSSDDKANGVAVDTSGNVYVTGYTGSGLDGNTSAGGTDIVLIKYDTSGNKIWTKQIGTSSDDKANGVAVDTSGNVYVTGYTGGGLDGNTSAGYNDIFLIKYDSNGNKIWTRQIGTSNFDYAYGVAVDTSGNVYVTGYTEGGLDGNTSAGGADIFLIKYDTN